MARLRSFIALSAVAALGLAFAPSTSAPTAPVAEAFAPQLITVHTPDSYAKAHLSSLGLDMTEHAGKDYVEVVLHSAEEEALLRDAGFTWDVRIADMLAREIERQELDAAYAAEVGVSPLPSGRTSYRVLADFGNEIDALVAAHPDVAKRISIGTSVEGRDLTGIEIGVGVNEPEDGRPVFLMFGAHHAREWPSAELPMEFAHDLLQGYTEGDARIVDLLTRGRAIIVPVSNPDGYDASRTSGDIVDLRQADNGGTASILATPGNAYKRKNCRYIDGQTHPAGTCVLIPSNGGLGVGIDLNRNYGALWGGPGASADRTSALYHGPAPFSEPETQAIRNLISTRQVTTLITNHTFSNLILRPVGIQPNMIHPDGNPIGFSPDECFATPHGDRGQQWLGERMAAQTGYINQFGWELYDTTGTTEDYSYNATGGYGYTFEIGHQEFHPPFADVVDEYVGTSAAAEAVTVDNAHERTTDAADDCGEHEHDSVGGGNREAYLLAFENAVDGATHSVIEGVAPEGATLTLTRTGEFPLWEGSMEDTVTTTMVARGGEFEWHVNPSTRPFVMPRHAANLGAPVAELSQTGRLRPLQTGTPIPFVVPEDTGIIRASVETVYPVDGQVVNYAQFRLYLLDEFGSTVASAEAFGPFNSLSWRGPDGEGVPAGNYSLRISNTAGSTGDYKLEATAQAVLGEYTEREFEKWSLTCETPAGDASNEEVFVDRGQTVDVGELC